MKSKNSYSGINPIIVRYVRYYAKCIKRLKCFAHESIEDVEQELFCMIWPTVEKYDEAKSSFPTFVCQLVKCRAINLIRKQSCKKRGGKEGVSYIDPDVLDGMIDERYHFSDEVADRIDADYVISTLPPEWQTLCKQLEVLSIPEAAEVNQMSRTTVYNTLDRVKRRTKKFF
ncbi:RNA polymerase sigma factor [Wolbachia endosymbiont of Folsomia candida]|uniref:RNA polymerase sigma factor n=1 Tax=Wolbachia endosymbiont of Folsomia candida TaxID=169402 RepID=UPI000A9B024C|nr:sigma-70 family RNA polymerase sigma factor [Wolbachia endosymbiont of Folsomia candida]APR98649.1 sigma-70 family RNA polymerase sigma factor [Wolbachia endosymbiont of Folsomia candida]